MKAYIQEIIKRKDLLFYLVSSGLKAQNRNSYLGYFWWLLDPLLNVFIYYFLMVVIVGRGGPDFPVYLVIGLVVWRWISSTINSSSKAITKYSGIISQVYMPKSIFPLAFSVTQLFNFLFGLIVIAIFLFAFRVVPTWHIVFLPYIILVQLLFLIAVSFLVAYITVFVRDIDNVMKHIVRLFFYSSPIIWEGSRLPERFDWIVAINPVAIVMNAYRDILMYHRMPDIGGLFIVAVMSTLAILYLIYHYSKNEHKIIKAL
ncbi:ABC transporter permease [Amphibacillus jilinensis]|uniref:ABC transporter permease n=1 Tax=Amphibacillus jilinensis TaxID=1216008 RepID=UPI000306594C|nr:ABC transporter permease [Amphibacillus jilinensis]